MTEQLIKAFSKDKELIEDIDRFPGNEKKFHVWWLGQSGFLLQWKGKRVLLDPYLSDSLTKKYHDTEKPHVRMSEQAVDPALLKKISIVSSSHNHTDHLDAETLVPILRNNPDIKFIIPEANREFVADRIKGNREFPIGLNSNRSIEIDEFIFHGIPAKHNEIERDIDGNCRYMGYVIQFGNFNIYHSGDTLWFDEMVELLKPFSVDLALLPINGNDPKRKVAGNLDCKEAAELGKAIDARWVIPCHYDMFSFNTSDVRDFEKEAKKINQAYKILKVGERFDIEN